MASNLLDILPPGLRNPAQKIQFILWLSKLPLTPETRRHTLWEWGIRFATKITQDDYNLLPKT